MKKVILISLMVAAVCGFVFSSQDTTLDQREVRDPKKLETWLEANASDAETRIAALESGSISSNLTIGGDTLSFVNVPTSTNGLAAGVVWSDSNTLKITP